MKPEVILDFDVPIWRFFWSDGTYKIPYEFEYNSKKYSNGITLIQFAWNLVSERDINRIKNDIVHMPNPVLCVADIKIFEIFKKKFTCGVVLANHNAFMYEDFYQIKNIPKKYNLIVNSSFEIYKRRHLCKKIKNCVHIGYFQTNDYINNKSFFPNNGIYPNFENGKEKNKENFNIIKTDKITEFINESLVGGIFSSEEGACWSSSEYLLCGIPVISTYSHGGRAHWYNEYNSIQCDDNEDSIKNAFDIAIKNLNNGTFNANKIREMHLQEMENQRNNLTNFVLDIFKKITLNIPNFNELKNSLKHYQLSLYGGFDIQKAIIANKILNLS